MGKLATLARIPGFLLNEVTRAWSQPTPIAGRQRPLPRIAIHDHRCVGSNRRRTLCRLDSVVRLSTRVRSAEELLEQAPELGRVEVLPLLQRWIRLEPTKRQPRVPSQFVKGAVLKPPTNALGPVDHDEFIEGLGCVPYDPAHGAHRIVSGKDLGPDVQAHGAPELGHDLDPFLGVGERLSFGPGPSVLGGGGWHHQVEERWLLLRQAKELRRGARSREGPDEEDQISAILGFVHGSLPSWCHRSRSHSSWTSSRSWRNVRRPALTAAPVGIPSASFFACSVEAPAPGMSSATEPEEVPLGVGRRHGSRTPEGGRGLPVPA
jgi:hypothetical protein